MVESPRRGSLGEGRTSRKCGLKKSAAFSAARGKARFLRRQKLNVPMNSDLEPKRSNLIDKFESKCIVVPSNPDLIYPRRGTINEAARNPPRRHSTRIQA